MFTYKSREALLTYVKKNMGQFQFLRVDYEPYGPLHTVAISDITVIFAAKDDTYYLKFSFSDGYLGPYVSYGTVTYQGSDSVTLNETDYREKRPSLARAKELYCEWIISF